MLHDLLPPVHEGGIRLLLWMRVGMVLLPLAASAVIDASAGCGMLF